MKFSLTKAVFGGFQHHVAVVAVLELSGCPKVTVVLNSEGFVSVLILYFCDQQNKNWTAGCKPMVLVWVP